MDSLAHYSLFQCPQVLDKVKCFATFLQVDGAAAERVARQYAITVPDKMTAYWIKPTVVIRSYVCE